MEAAGERDEIQVLRNIYDMRRLRGTPRGYTLLEILIVMALAGVFVAMILPDFNRVIPEMKVDKAARKLATDIRMAQQLAVSEMSYVWFWLDPSENQYRTWILNRESNWEELEDPLKSGASLRVDFDEINAFQGVRVTAEVWLIYSPLGSLRSPNNDVTITLQHSTTGYSRQIHIDYPLGKVRVLP